MITQIAFKLQDLIEFSVKLCLIRFYGVIVMKFYGDYGVLCNILL